MAVCMVFSLQIGPGFIFESVFQKPFSCSTLGLDLFSGANLNKFTVSVVLSDDDDDDDNWIQDLTVPMHLGLS
jgi:hypothetical protein